jgi:hypothetical protein
VFIKNPSALPPIPWRVYITTDQEYQTKQDQGLAIHDAIMPSMFIKVTSGKGNTGKAHNKTSNDE